jgi:hypothetical protein
MVVKSYGLKKEHELATPLKLIYFLVSDTIYSPEAKSSFLKDI